MIVIITRKFGLVKENYEDDNVAYSTYRYPLSRPETMRLSTARGIWVPLSIAGSKLHNLGVSANPISSASVAMPSFSTKAVR